MAALKPIPRSLSANGQSPCTRPGLLFGAWTALLAFLTACGGGDGGGGSNPTPAPFTIALEDMPDTAMTAAVMACFAAPTSANPAATSEIRGL